MCVDEKGDFREDNFTKATGAVSKEAPKSQQKGRKGGEKDVRNQSDLFKIIKMIWLRNYQPVIVFSFSKRECESNALQISKLDFNSQDEKDMVSAVFQNAVGSLTEDDRKLPQIQHLLPLLQRGIGIHHSGLLQILKEVIEILFQEGLIKVLFATETFSIGLNMPAKTVVFTSVRKFDGTDMRWISSGEYIQMSGRAGRRGLDDRGIVLLMIDEEMEPAVAKEMLRGDADALNSAFHLEYNMILNLMRVEGISPEFMLERSFFQFQNNSSVPRLESRIEELKSQRDAITIEDEVNIAEYFTLYLQLQTYEKDLRDVVHHPSYCLQFIQPGRLVKINDNGIDYDWGVVVNVTKKAAKKQSRDVAKAELEYVIDALVYCAPQADQVLKTIPPPCPQDVKGELCIVPITFATLCGVSSVKIFIPKDLRNLDSRNAVLKSLKEVKRRFESGLPILNYVKDLNIRDKSFFNLLKKLDTLKRKISENPLVMANDEGRLKELYEQYSMKVQYETEIKLANKEAKKCTDIMQLEELKCRKRVLRRLGYTSSVDVVEMKGRVACEISTGDELLLTEMMFNGVFTDLTVDQTVALLSCAVCDEKNDKADKPREELTAPLKILKETAKNIAKLSLECKLVLDEQEYVDSFRHEMMDIVYAWSSGAKFSDICKMTEIFEGSIIRVLRRLEELLRQMAAAARQIGNTELEEKFTSGISKIKRDIVFAASLYL